MHQSIHRQVNEFSGEGARERIFLRENFRVFLYEEKNLTVENTKTNFWFVGEERRRTVISGEKSVAHHFTTFESASFDELIHFITLENRL
ncbi:putative pectinesterase/pectinesterase inhibitor 61 [Bienertia sinuspersici]